MARPRARPQHLRDPFDVHGGSVDPDIAARGFSLPCEEAVRAVAEHAPDGVVEIGAGTGYWARALDAVGVRVHAYDLDPPPSPTNPWFAGANPWFDVCRGDHRMVDRHPDATLLLVWPTRDETWPARALERYRAAGGTCVVYVGEEPGGATGDDRFHALLGDLSTCLHHGHGVLASPCICDVSPQWRRVAEIEVPQRPGHHDRLAIYRPIRTRRGRRNRWWRRQS
jgi:hypothetical protein